MSTIGVQYVINELTFGCSTSPYNDFKSEHYGDAAPEGIVDIYSRDWIIQPTFLLRAAMIEALPIYDDTYIDLEHLFTPFSVAFPISAPIQIHTFHEGDTKPILAVMTESLFVIFDAIYIIGLSLVLTNLWKKSRTDKIAAIVILLFVFKYAFIFTGLPLMLFPSIHPS